MTTLMLIDGNSLTYRAFHALPQELATASGQVTNAVFGFTSMLINLLRDHQPDGVIVAFDRREPTFRHEQLESYKANREKAPDILHQQMGLVREVLTALRIPTVDLVGYEADDIIATLAHKAQSDGRDVLIVTGDRDAFQLVSDPHIKVVYNRRGVSDYALYDEAGIMERTGVTSQQYVDYAALRGDPSDNLPGVPGVGEKTAAKLITKYGDLDGIFAHLDEQTPKLRQNLTEHQAAARQNLALMRLVDDAPVDVDLSAVFEPLPYDVDEVRELFDFLEFRTLFDRLPSAFGPSAAGAEIDPDRTIAVDVLDALVDDAAIAQWAAQSIPVAVALGRDGAAQAGHDPISGMAIIVPTQWSSLDQRGQDDAAADDAAPDAVVEAVWVPTDAVDRFAPLWADDGPGLAAHDAKALLRWLHNLGHERAKLRLDTALGGYLLDPAGSAYPLAELLQRYTTRKLPTDMAPPSGQLFIDGPEIAPSMIAALEAAAVSHLAPIIQDRLHADGLSPLNDEIEVPLVGVLARMEELGIGVDRDELAKLNADLTAEAEQLAHQIHLDAGEVFNVNSTKKLQEILFDKLGLTKGKKIKTGYSTDQATLEKLVDEHPIAEHLLRYREVEKLRSTYGESLLGAIAADGRIHAVFNQTVARTGRLSSENPNLHNIPVRSELGRLFRRAFIPAPSYRFLVADYNQIELRCIAHLAQDPGLIEAFRSGTDIHTAVAATVFGVDPSEVHFEQRNRAKMVSYGLAYGMEAYGLGQRLGIPTKEAALILDAYFEGFPRVRDYMDETVSEARKRGYTETLFGRRRAIPELMSDNPRIRQAGERQAMNAGIQGLAADIFKVALVRLDDQLANGDLKSRLVLQVHDEVIVEVAEGEEAEAETVVLDVMHGAFDLAVPLEVNLSVGSSWAEAKD